jgi:hypothetical protein
MAADWRDEEERLPALLARQCRRGAIRSAGYRARQEVLVIYELDCGCICELRGGENNNLSQLSEVFRILELCANPPWGSYAGRECRFVQSERDAMGGRLIKPENKKLIDPLAYSLKVTFQ